MADSHYLSPEGQAAVQARARDLREALNARRAQRVQAAVEPDGQMRNVLVLAEFRSRDRRFTGEPLTGFGAL
jgi:hypothetical protein